MVGGCACWGRGEGGFWVIGAGDGSRVLEKGGVDKGGIFLSGFSIGGRWGESR